MPGQHQAQVHQARARHYEALVSSLNKRIPFSISREEIAGLSRGAAARRYGALAMCIDGYVYKWHAKGAVPRLASAYEHGSQIWPLEKIRAAGAAFVRAIVDYSNSAE